MFDPAKYYDEPSLKERRFLHPLMKKLADACIVKRRFRILDSKRGKAEQELAFARKKSKVHFGNSAHNYNPAPVMDICPFPIQFKNEIPFIKLFREVILPTAKELKIPVRWLGDPDFNPNTKDGWDYPHIELHPWRKYKGTLYNG